MFRQTLKPPQSDALIQEHKNAKVVKPCQNHLIIIKTIITETSVGYLYILDNINTRIMERVKLISQLFVSVFFRYFSLK
jgi:hypothetical protein